MKAHLNQHCHDQLPTTYHSIVKTVRSKIGDLFTKFLTLQLQELLRTSCTESIVQNNSKKLRNLIKIAHKPLTKYTVPIINLSSYHLIQKEYE